MTDIVEIKESDEVGRFRSGRIAGIAALIAAGSLALAACGSDSNGSGGGSTSALANTTTTSAATAGGGNANSGNGSCASGKLTADGSTAQQNAVNAWIKAYNEQCSGVQITYGGVGSGQGITDFTTGKVDFAGSDAALDPTQGQLKAASKQCGSPALDIPMVTGPVAVAFNVKGVSDLTLTPSVVAKIFTGKIKTWDDPAIANLNKGARLPSANITVFFRSDESGTTQNFETYLHDAAASDYKTPPSKDWSGTGQGKTGSQGVQSAIKSTDNSIGYLEWSYAGSAGLSMAKIDNGGGPVALTAQTAGKAVAAAKLASQSGDDLTLQLDYATKTPGAYPIILVTYEIVCSKYQDASVGKNVKAFLTYTGSSAGQQLLPSVGSAPLPASILAKVRHVVAKIS